MSLKYSNKATTTLSAGVSSGATSFTVVDASEFPTLGTGDWTYVTLGDADVVKVTAINTSTKVFTCAATSSAHSSGDKAELRITAELMDDARNTTEFGLYEHRNIIDADYTINTGFNAISADPMTIDSSVTVTIPSGSTWVIIA
jgi:hypothetical protein